MFNYTQTHSETDLPQEVRVIDENGHNIGIVETKKAKKMAEDLGLELIIIDPKSSTPVVRIADFGKLKYQNSKKEKENKRHQHAQNIIKEVCFRPKIDNHDYKTKLDNIISFLKKGYKVKIKMQFFGREISHADIGQAVVDRIIKDTAAFTLQTPISRLEGKNIWCELTAKQRTTS